MEGGMLSILGWKSDAIQIVNSAKAEIMERVNNVGSAESCAAKLARDEPLFSEKSLRFSAARAAAAPAACR